LFSPLGDEWILLPLLSLLTYPFDGKPYLDIFGRRDIFSDAA